jgi:heparan-alpha-glucosaminide N-acetyltransferase
MFLVGFIAASGGFPKPASENDPSDYRLSHIRIPGILQRIAFCYFITVCIHVWVPVREPEPSPNSIAYGRTKLSLYKKYLWHWIAAVILLGIWFILMFGTNVPGCGYGNLDQECNAAGYWDRMIIGSRHMYAHPTLNRSPECSWNSPGYDPIPGAPAWCTKPFDPEGIAGSFTACVTGFFGLFFGLVLSNEQKHERRLTHWLSLSGVSMVVGLILHFSGVIPMNKNLWSPAYVFVMVGVDGAVFSIFYYLVDMKLMKKVLFPMICMVRLHYGYDVRRESLSSWPRCTVC